MLILASLDCGGIKLRYTIAIKKPTGWNVDCSLLLDEVLSSKLENCFPIFLAADVFKFLNTNSSSSSGALTRYLNKMQTWKILTKVQFESIQVEGITNCKLVNFVSVQGVFTALFSSPQSELQAPVVSSLLKVWQTYSSFQLPPAIQYQCPSGREKVPTQSPSDKTLSSTLDNLIQTLDESCYEQSLHISALRNVLNSLRSVYTGYGDSGLTKLLTYCEALIQDLLANVHRDSATSHEENVDKLILECVSSWIGRNFGEQNSSIQQKIRRFKTDNIQSVDNLPSPRDTCQLLFPDAMMRLFEEWLSRTHSSHTTNDDCETSPKSKHPRTHADIYPFIQLILEFANNSLISGVAHVVFSRLILDPKTHSIS